MSFVGVELQQTFDPHDLVLIGLLVVLEGVLSIDNALVLSILARRLPTDQRKKSLTYGLIGALAFRLISIALATILIRIMFVKLLGGAYLLWIAIKHFFIDRHGDADLHAKAAAAGVIDRNSISDGERANAVQEIKSHAPILKRKKQFATFWPTVFVIELTDIAFAVDSILAAIGIVGNPPPGTPKDALHPKYWVILTGGFLGVVLMRFAAILFIKLLEAFPRFEIAAYILIVIIGLKLFIDWTAYHFALPIDFHHITSPAFWVFWILMILAFCIGFIREKKNPSG
jgi:YkoY family integral membrane protein